MVSVSAVIRSSPQAVSVAMGARSQVKGLGLASLAFLSTVVVFSGLPSVSCVGERVVTSVSPTCNLSGLETKCSCTSPAATAANGKDSAALSKEANSLRVECGGDLQFAPAGQGDNIVCPTDFHGLNECKLDLPTLLGGEPSGVKWEECSQGGERSAGKCKTLSIPQANLPFVDQNFVVGCTHSSNGSETLCKINVALKARASETNGQTVTCAYGAGSNESRQAVTLNPSKNSFTLVCGDKGTVLPTNYDTKFCSSDPEDKTDTCNGDYQSTLPGFEEGWWKKDAPTANSFTLSIPVEKFPKEPAKVVVACQLTKQDSGSRKAAEDEATSSVCRVDVTIEAGSLASLSLGSWHLSSCLVAFAVTFVMARGI